MRTISQGFLLEKIAAKPLAKYLACLFFMLFLYGNSQAQDANLLGRQLHFRHYSLEQGLSHTNITAILQDKNGYIWAGTQNGLNKFDGYSFINYYHEENNPSSLSDNWVWSLYEDSRGNVWAGTAQGLSRYSGDCDCFENIAFPNRLSNSIQQGISDIKEDVSGNLWMASYGYGLIKYSLADTTFAYYQHDAKDSNSLGNNFLNAVAIDTKGRIWVGSERSGISIFHPETQKFTNITTAQGLPHNHVRDLEPNAQGEMWVATFGGGIAKVNIETLEIDAYSTDNSKLSSDLVWRVLVDQRGSVWICTDGGGLCLLRPEAKDFSVLRPQAHRPQSISDDVLWSIYEDRQHNIWIGGYTGGLNLLPYHAKPFFYLQQHPVLNNTLSSNSISSFLETRDGNFWVGTDGGGLNFFDRDKQTFKHFQHDPEMRESLTSNAVTDLLEGLDGKIWIATFGGGLNYFDPKTNKFQSIALPQLHTEAARKAFIFDLEYDQRQRLWVASLFGGVIVLDWISGDWKQYTANPDDPNSISSNNVIALCQDRYGDMWVGTQMGLNRFDAASQSFVKYLPDPKQAFSLVSPWIFSIYEDKKGQIWVGTKNGGLHLYDRAQQIFRNFSQKDGLPDNNIYSIQDDAEGNIWVSTGKGLSKLTFPADRPLHPQITNYNRYDGLLGGPFNVHSSYTDKQGVMYWGGLQGMHFFHPDSIHENPIVSKAEITGLKIYNKPVSVGHGSPLKKPISETSSITFSHEQRVFSLEFAALDYTAPMKHQYAYKLEKFDEEWRYTDAQQRIATYTNLDPGEYFFRVKATNSDGVWGKDSTLTIIVRPPWWDTWWFKGLVFGSLLLITAWIIRYRVRRAEKRRLELEALVKERTAEVLAQKAKIEKQQDAMKRQNKLLGEKNRVLEDLNREKDGLVGVVAHDLKSPLNRIKGLMSILKLSGPLNDMQQDGLEMIGQVIKDGLLLIHDLLDISAFEYAEQPLNIVSTDIVELVENQRQTHQYYADTKSIGFHIETPEALEWPTDKECLLRIVDNLISNAIKYTPADRNIYVEVSANAKYLKLVVRDEGLGIKEEDMPKLFQKFQKLSARPTAGEHSTGLGLSIVKMLVDRLNGAIQVKSPVNEGTTFTVLLPKLEITSDSY